MKENRTQLELKQALLTLLNDHPIDKITVQMITDVVGCSRKTFYYYFSDVYTLTRDICQDSVQRFLDEGSTAENGRSALLAFADHLRRNRRILLNMYHGYGQEELERFAWVICHYYATRAVTSHSGSAAISPEELDALIHMYSSLLLGMIVRWLHDGPGWNYILTLDIAFRSIPNILGGLNPPAAT